MYMVSKYFSLLAIVSYIVSIYSMLHFTPNNPFMHRSAPDSTGRAYATSLPRHTRYIPLIRSAALAALATWHMFLSIHTCISCIARTAARAARVPTHALVNIRILAGYIHAAFISPLYFIYICSTRLPTHAPARRLATLPAASDQRALYRSACARLAARGTNPTHESRPLSSANHPDSIPIPRDGRRTIRRAVSPPFYFPRPFVKFCTRIYI